MSHNCCFSKNSRLRKPSEYNLVYQQNQTRVRGQYFIVLAFSRFKADEQITNNLPCDVGLQNCARLGAVVSKKVSKLAVKRNSIKRVIRNNFRLQHKLPLFDFVIIAKPAARDASNLQKNKELDYLWIKVRKQCESF